MCIRDRTKPFPVTLDSGIKLNVIAQGTSPLIYEWYKDEKLIENAESNMLSIENAELSDVGNYYVIVSNQYGAAVSDEIKVTVTLPKFHLGFEFNNDGRLMIKAFGSDNFNVTFQMSEDLINWVDRITLPIVKGSTSLSLPVSVKGDAKLFYRLKLAE